MQPVFIGLFDSPQDVFEQFEVPAKLRHEVDILLAYYSDEDYSGDAFVLCKGPDGGLWGVSGSHCSCYGLEGQWEPEPTSTAALRHRVSEGRLGTESGWRKGRANTFAQELLSILNELDSASD